MKKLLLSAAAAALFAGGAAIAQDSKQFDGPYVVGEIGYENFDPGGFGVDGFIYGGALGYNFRLNGNVYFGIEGDIRGTTVDGLDFAYGATANVGFLANDRTAFFVRGGYREIETDGFGSAGDYVVGLGGQFGLSDALSVRTVVDTIGFDTVEAKVGVVLDF